MWKFPVLSSSSARFSCASLRLQTRLKHNEPFFDNLSVLNFAHGDISTFRDQRSLVIPNVLGNSPLRELTSLDDFGHLSGARSTESTSSPETSFLDHLLRSDSLPQFSGVRIPTTIDTPTSEPKDFFGLDQAVVLLSDGADVTTVVEDLADYANTCNQGQLHDDQEPSTSISEPSEDLPFLVPDVLAPKNTRTRQFLTEKLRNQRKSLLLLHQSVVERRPKPEFIKNVGEMMFPEAPMVEIFPAEALPVAAKVVVEREVSSPILTLDLENLEQHVFDENFAQLSLLLENGKWPAEALEDRRLLHKVNRILKFAIQKSTDSDEALRYLSQFAASGIQACLSDDVLLALAGRIVTEKDLVATSSRIALLGRMCLTREAKPAHSAVRKALKQLYQLSLEKGSIAASKCVMEVCVELNFDKSAELFLKTATRYAHEQSHDFEDVFKQWSALSSLYGTTSGVESLWLVALTNDVCRRPLSWRIEKLLLHCQTSDHPFLNVGHLICALVRLDRVPEAEEIFKKISVSGRYFKQPLSTIVDEGELESVERLATLVSKCMIGERRRGPRKAAVATEAQSDANILNVLNKVFGLTAKKPKFVPFGKRKQKKMHRVDEEQLHELLDAVQMAWISCAESRGDANAAKKLIDWCATNRVDVDEKVAKRAEKLAASLPISAEESQ